MAARSEFRLGWKTLVAGIVGVACGASPLPFNTIGFTIGPIHEETGWSFAEISLGITVYGIVASLLAPVFGWLADKYGVRPVALWSTFAFAIAFALVGFAPVMLGAFYATWFFVGLVGIGSTPVTWSRAVNMWFFRNRGLALGLLLVGTSIAALTVPRLAVIAIDVYGWRGMYPALALLPLLIALPIAFIWFREPRPDEQPAEITAGGTLVGVSLGEALRDRRFWTIWLSIALVALAYGGAHIHMPEIIKQHGMTAAEGAGIMGLIGVALLAGRIITGFLLDRFWAPAVCLPILTIPAIACWWLMGTSSDTTTIYLGAFMLGFAAGAESDLIAYLASRYFGMANYGRIYGMLYMPFGIASAISPVLYGRVRDVTGSYDGMLWAAMFLFVGGALLLLTLGRYPTFGRSAEQEPTPGAVPA
ncbi:putative sulfoacetate transporter SauU [Tsuneonella dongtanensis]|uniref:Putative sulfoacetate transporter SauU n=1 Tax=Tsuneonella dongtanensis TaxID=692370 RepID=A0A1B2AG76_9SPHN|nr:MFS transporter [Tsuneonella dongtanensis]ANY21108.1 putative sulfoacetate transporter SauU [Tsuneonella dongtanensis]